MEKSEKSKVLVLGVTGSIAAYKACEITSQLAKAGIEVNVIMTDAAQKLICPRTFFTLSRNPVTTSLWDEPVWQPKHISLAERAQVLLIAPATADIIAKMAHGIADDALSTYYLSHTGKVIIAPAMNPRMWNHVAVQENMEILRSRGVQVVGPVEGAVACGESGMGRLAEPAEIIAAVSQEFVNL